MVWLWVRRRVGWRLTFCFPCFPLSLPQERMALDDHIKGSKGGDKDVHVMHDFIRKQAINQQADYSVRV